MPGAHDLLDELPGGGVVDVAGIVSGVIIVITLQGDELEGKPGVNGGECLRQVKAFGNAGGVDIGVPNEIGGVDRISLLAEGDGEPIGGSPTGKNFVDVDVVVVVAFGEGLVVVIGCLAGSKGDASKELVAELNIAADAKEEQLSVLLGGALVRLEFGVTLAGGGTEGDPAGNWTRHHLISGGTVTVIVIALGLLVLIVLIAEADVAEEGQIRDARVECDFGLVSGNQRAVIGGIGVLIAKVFDFSLKGLDLLLGLGLVLLHFLFEGLIVGVGLGKCLAGGGKQREGGNADEGGTTRHKG